MTPRERILCTLNHKEPDVVPIDLGSTDETSINILAYQRLKKFLGVQAEDKIMDRMQQIAFVDEKILKHFGVEARCLMLSTPDNLQERTLPDGTWVDEWGIARQKPASSYYYDVVRSPFANGLSKDKLRKYNWPNPHDPGRFRGLREQGLKIREEGYATVFCPYIYPLTLSQMMRGFEGWFCDLLLSPHLIEALMDKILEFQLLLLDEALYHVGDIIDIILIGDDFCTQKSPMFAPRMYHKLFKPRHKKIVELIHSRTEAKVMFHSCGNVYEFIPDLIEIGIDILNPVQVAIPDMDSCRLKREFGKDLSFWGGIDTQRVLPYMDVETVKSEVRKRINHLSKGGGYVVAAVHNIQTDVPPQNICAMFSEARRYGMY